MRRAGGVGGVREGAWVRRAPAGSGSGRHVEEGTWCCSNDDACRSAAPPIAPLPSRRVAASRGQYRWCGGGGSLHRPAAGAAITSMRGGCRRLVWLEAYAAPPKPYCRSSAWRLGRAAVVVADGIWRRRRRLALPSWPVRGFPLAPYLVSFPCFLLVSLQHPLVSWGNSSSYITQFPGL